MKYVIPIFLGCCFVMISSNAVAQRNVGQLMLDPAFANNGKSVIDFEGYNDDATCFVINLGLNRILAAGKVYTSTPGEIRFGVIEYDATGLLESGFGTDGKSDLTWSGVDYANAIDLLPDGSIIAAGASATNGTQTIPTFFRLKPDGTPDLTFGTEGHAYASNSPLGEFESLDTIRTSTGSLRYIATGVANIGSSNPGFCAMSMDSSGHLDPLFGNNGISLISAPNLSSPQGHLVDGNKILFAGLMATGTSPEIIFCRLLPNGMPDSSFGTNGVLKTEITLRGGNWLHSVYDQSTFDTFPGLLVAAPLSDSSTMLPFTIIKFKLDGTLDSNYGINGIATAPVISTMQIYGMTPPNTRGYTHLCGGIGSVSATVQFLPGGAVDSTFGTDGIALMDANNGLRKNFLIGFTPVSKQFIGIGTSVNVAGNDDFLVARYIPGSASVSLARNDNSPTMQLYPNPARGFVQVRVLGGPIEHISLRDALGRALLSFEQPSFATNSNSYFLDVSKIPNGSYDCIIQTNSGISSEHFTVIH